MAIKRQHTGRASSGLPASSGVVQTILGQIGAKRQVMDQRVSLVQRLSERYIKLPSLLEFLVYVPTDTLIPVGGVHYRQFMPATRDGETGYLVMSGTTRPLYILEADYLELTGALDSYLEATHYFGHHVGGERIAQLWLGWEKAEKAEEA